MTKPKWTPGPWTIEDPMGPESLWIVEAGKQTYEWRCIAMVCVDDEEDDGRPTITPAMQKANAALLGSAPDLFAALDAAPPPPVEATAAEARAWLLDYAAWYAQVRAAALSAGLGEGR